MLERFSWTLLLWSGLTAVIVSTWALMIFRKLGATIYLPRAYWSCALFGGTGDFALIAAGLLRLLAFIVLFPALYAFIFEYTGRAEALIGALIGAGHAVLAGAFLPLAARRCRGAKPPGLFGWNLGRATPLVLLVVHALYGTLLGYIYVNG